MIKQIKRIVAILGVSTILIGEIFFPIMVAENSVTTVSSDVVESKSVIVEQICKAPMPEVSVNKVVTNAQEVYLKGWTNTGSNVRKKPDLNATILTTYSVNTQVEYVKYNDTWVKIKYGEDVAYMAEKLISNNKVEIQKKVVAIALAKNDNNQLPHHKDFKSYMGYKAITNKSSQQYQLQQLAYTDENGLRKINGRYCVAIGSHWDVDMGENFDLILENGTIIPCIKADAKADRDTDSSNIYTANGCCSEFIVDTANLDKSAKTSGNISSIDPLWNSPVKTIISNDEV